MVDLIDEREAGLAFGEDVFRGNFALFNVANDGTDLVGMKRITRKREMEIGGCYNVERNHCARGELRIAVRGENNF